MTLIRRTRTDAGLLPVLTAAIAMAAVPSHRSAAEEFTWYAYAGADGYFSSSDWFTPTGRSGTPGPSDTAIFDLPVSYTVTVTETVAVDRVLVRAGDLTLAGKEPFAFEMMNPSFMTPGLVVGEESGDVATLTLGAGTWSAAYAALAEHPASIGTLNLKGQESSLVVDATLWAPFAGLGFLNITDGATLECGDATIGAALASFGEAEVAGAGTQWTCSGELTVGMGALASLHITDGATISSADAIVGQQEGAAGIATVDGPETYWIIEGSLTAGLFGSAELHATDGATVAVGGDATFGAFLGIPVPFDRFLTHFDTIPLSYGAAVIAGNGSQFIVDGDLTLGLLGNGGMVLSDGGRAIVGGDVAYAPSFLFHPATVELADSSNYIDGPAVTAQHIDLNVEILLADSFAPEAGDAFWIAQWVAVDKPIDVTLPDLADGLQWVVEHTDTELIIHVVAFGDLDADGVVGVGDLLELFAAWGSCPESGYCAADLTGDGEVGVDDLLALLALWSA